MKGKPSFTRSPDQARQAEADKMGRLRALRLAKEAAEKEAAAQAAAVAAEQAKLKRSRSSAASGVKRAAGE